MPTFKIKVRYDLTSSFVKKEKFKIDAQTMTEAINKVKKHPCFPEGNVEITARVIKYT